MKVWECKIVIEAEDLPMGFDYPPRRAAMQAIADAGFEIKECFSGWGGSLSEGEQALVDDNN